MVCDVSPVAMFLVQATEQSSKHKMSQTELLMGDMLCLYVGAPQFVFFRFLSQYLAGGAAYLCFGPYSMENRSKNAKKSTFFKIGLYLPENGNA